MLNISKVPTVLILLGGLVLLPGCTMYGVVKVSEPVLPRINDSPVELKDDILLYRDISVSVKPQNYYVAFFSAGVVVPVVPFPTVGDSPIKRKGEKFLLVVQMETEKKEFRFDPALLTIQYNNELYRPIVVRGPYPGDGEAREVGRAVPGHKWECIPPREETMSSAGALDVTGKACFEAEFPLDTLDPEKEFRVVLNGIERNGLPLPAVTLIFRPSLRGGLTLMM